MPRKMIAIVRDGEDITGHIFQRYIWCPIHGHLVFEDSGFEGRPPHYLCCFCCHQDVTAKVGVLPGFFLVQIQYESVIHDYCIMRRIRGKKNAVMILRNPEGTLLAKIGKPGIMRTKRIPQKNILLYLHWEATKEVETVLRGE